MDNGVRFLYNKYQKKIGELKYGFVNYIHENKVYIDIEENKVEGMLIQSNDIKDISLYEEGEGIYGYIGMVSLSEAEDKVLISFIKNDEDFIIKLFNHLKMDFDFEDIEIKKVDVLEDDINIYVKSKVENVESILMDIESIMVECMKPKRVSIKLDKTVIEKITSNTQISKGDKIIHDIFGQCDIILSIDTDECKWIGIKCEGGEARVIDVNEEIENKSIIKIV